MKIRRLVERSNKRRVFLRFIFTFKLPLILVAFVLFLIEFAEASEPIKSRIKIVDYKFTPSYVGMETLSIEGEKLMILKNVGKEVVEVDDIVFCGVFDGVLKKEGEQSFKVFLFPLPSSWCIGVGKTLRISFGVGSPRFDLFKEIGAEEVKGKIKVFGYVRKGKKRLGKEQVLGEEEVSIPVPKVKFGETVKLSGGLADFSITFLSWKVSDRVVDWADYVFPPLLGNCTFKAKPGRKFIILTYELKNDGIEPKEAPSIRDGKIGTDKGHVLPSFSSPSWLDRDESLVREATEEEIEDLKIGEVGDVRGKLLPSETVRGRIAFEMLTNEEPIEASIECVSPLLRF
jgi:hypothetical protein